MSTTKAEGVTCSCEYLGSSAEKKAFVRSNEHFQMLILLSQFHLQIPHKVSAVMKHLALGFTLRMAANDENKECIGRETWLSSLGRSTVMQIFEFWRLQRQGGTTLRVHR